MTGQDQRVAKDGVAIQSGGDPTINKGMSSDDLKQIIESIAAQLPAYAAIAKEIVDARLVDFEERIIARFDQDPTVDRQAFADPDFQYLLLQAQKSHARSGDKDTADLLVDLIAERSKAKERNRLALTLNQAVEIVPNLTLNEIAELCVCYLFSRTQDRSMKRLDDFHKFLNDRIEPYIDDLLKSPSSYEFLEAQRCANVSAFETKFYDLLTKPYSAFFSKGFSEAQISGISSELSPRDPELFIECLRDPTKLQLRAMNEDVWSQLASKASLPDNIKQALWKLSKATMMSREEGIEALLPCVPRIRDMADLWDESPLRQLRLTAAGTAIAYSYASTHDFEADISIWIN